MLQTEQRSPSPNVNINLDDLFCFDVKEKNLAIGVIFISFTFNEAL